MDYHDDSAGTANLAVIKYTAAEPGKSKGSVFINPGVYWHQLPRIPALIYFGGGPGGPGTAAVPALGESLSAIFGGQYDIVSWDPRGSAGYYTSYAYLPNSVCIAFTLSAALAW